MHRWLLALLLSTWSIHPLFADGPISFSPALPSSWVVKADKDVVENNTKGHVVVIVNTNEARSITVGVSQLSKEEAAKDFERNGRNWCAGAVDGIRGDDKVTKSKLTFKTLDGQKIAEATCTVSTPDIVLHGLCRCWRSKDRMVGWIAVGAGVPVENEKQILDIAASIKIAD